MNGGTCLHETPGKRVPRGRKKNVRCNRSSLLTNSLPYKEGQLSADPEISRFPCKERACMPGSPTTPGRPSACDGALRHVAFRYTDSVGTRNNFSVAAQWLACTFPC